MLQTRIARAAARCIKGHEFSAALNDDIVEAIFEQINAVERTPLRLGPVLSSTFLKGQKDHMQGVGAFVAHTKVPGKQYLDLV